LWDGFKHVYEDSLMEHFRMNRLFPDKPVLKKDEEDHEAPQNLQRNEKPRFQLRFKKRFGLPKWARSFKENV
jgi:hypothetical protein